MLTEEQRSTTKNGLTWFKAKKSSGNGNCVEFAGLKDGQVALRDSKNPDTILRFTAAEWDAFVTGVRDDEFVITS